MSGESTRESKPVPSDFSEFPILVAAARYVVDGTGSSAVVSDDDAMAAIAAARHDRITGMLAWAVEAGAVALPDGQRAQLDASWRQELATCVALEALIVRTSTMLEGAGVRHLVTKGAAVAHLDYPDPAIRTFGDVDLVIHPDEWHAGVDALIGSGFSRVAPALPFDFDHRYGKGATLLAPSGQELDLHRRFAIGRFGVTSVMEDAFENATTINLAARTIPVPSLEVRLLHACYHASLGGFRRLRAFTDVARLATRPGIDLAATYTLARAWRAEAVVIAAIRETWRRLGLDDDHAAVAGARERQISRADARALRVFAEHRPFSRQALTGVPRLGLRAPRYLLALGVHRLRHRET